MSTELERALLAACERAEAWGAGVMAANREAFLQLLLTIIAHKVMAEWRDDWRLELTKYHPDACLYVEINREPGQPLLLTFYPNPDDLPRLS